MVPDVQSGTVAVTGGRADALMTGEFGITNPGKLGLELIVDEKVPVSGYGLVFRKEDVAFRDAFNKQLNELRSNGTIKERLLKVQGDSGFSKERAAADWDVLAKLNTASDLISSCK